MTEDAPAGAEDTVTGSCDPSASGSHDRRDGESADPDQAQGAGPHADRPKVTLAALREELAREVPVEGGGVDPEALRAARAHMDRIRATAGISRLGAAGVAGLTGNSDEFRSAAAPQVAAKKYGLVDGLAGGGVVKSPGAALGEAARALGPLDPAVVRRTGIAQSSTVVDAARRSAGLTGAAAMAEALGADLRAKYPSLFDVDVLAKRHLGELSKTLGRLDVTKSFIGGAVANARVIESMGGVIAADAAAAKLAGLAGEATVSSRWARELRSQAETRDWMLNLAAEAAPARRLLSARPLSAYSRYIDDVLDGEREAGRLRDEVMGGASCSEAVGPGARHGGVVYGYAAQALAAQDALLSPLADDDLGAVIEVVEAEIVEPWSRARSQTGFDLVDRLRELDPKVAEMLIGAWNALDSRGPGYLESAAHLAMEAISRTVRRLAPDEAVATWITVANIPSQGLWARPGVLTRTARLRYIKRDASKEERKVLNADADAIARTTEGLARRLNAVKHESAGDDAVVRTLLVTTEGVLLRLLP